MSENSGETINTILNYFLDSKKKTAIAKSGSSKKKETNASKSRTWGVKEEKAIKQIIAEVLGEKEGQAVGKSQVELAKLSIIIAVVALLAIFGPGLISLLKSNFVRWNREQIHQIIEENYSWCVTNKCSQRSGTIIINQ